jgi:hypothetical protein
MIFFRVQGKGQGKSGVCPSGPAARRASAFGTYGAHNKGDFTQIGLHPWLLGKSRKTAILYGVR